MHLQKVTQSHVWYCVSLEHPWGRAVHREGVLSTDGDIRNVVLGSTFGVTWEPTLLHWRSPSVDMTYLLCEVHHSGCH